MIAWLRRQSSRELTQVEACAAMRTATVGLPAPRPTVDPHGRPRVGWDVADGREKLSLRLTKRRSA